jgi:hypothetical protein
MPLLRQYAALPISFEASIEMQVLARLDSLFEYVVIEPGIIADEPRVLPVSICPFSLRTRLFPVTRVV